MSIICALCEKEVDPLCDEGREISHNLYVCSNCISIARGEMLDYFLVKKLSQKYLLQGDGQAFKDGKLCDYRSLYMAMEKIK